MYTKLGHARIKSSDLYTGKFGKVIILARTNFEHVGQALLLSMERRKECVANYQGSLVGNGKMYCVGLRGGVANSG